MRNIPLIPTNYYNAKDLLTASQAAEYVQLKNENLSTILIQCYPGFIQNYKGDAVPRLMLLVKTSNFPR